MDELPDIVLEDFSPFLRRKVGELIGGPDHVQRLRELGIRAGVQIEMVQPGSPCIVLLDGHRLCFRETDLIGILVRPGVTV